MGAPTCAALPLGFDAGGNRLRGDGACGSQCRMALGERWRLRHFPAMVPATCAALPLGASMLANPSAFDDRPSFAATGGAWRPVAGRRPCPRALCAPRCGAFGEGDHEAAHTLGRQWIGIDIAGMGFRRRRAALGSHWRTRPLGFDAAGNRLRWVAVWGCPRLGAAPGMCPPRQRFFWRRRSSAKVAVSPPFPTSPKALSPVAGTPCALSELGYARPTCVATHNASDCQTPNTKGECTSEAHTRRTRRT